jgi:hypothetical protein
MSGIDPGVGVVCGVGSSLDETFVGSLVGVEVIVSSFCEGVLSGVDPFCGLF